MANYAFSIYEGEISNCLSTLGVHSIGEKVGELAKYLYSCVDSFSLFLSLSFSLETTGQVNRRAANHRQRFSFPYSHVLRRVDRSP